MRLILVVLLAAAAGGVATLLPDSAKVRPVRKDGVDRQCCRRQDQCLDNATVNLSESRESGLSTSYSY